ncbi:SDR family NAD(P)-dependent oxidoreductase [Frigoriflavimonas asaccharolytica]|uniref:NAD(P)-dependent dehydrogenase (Short-subunit alcohol dehydrogenase family) n=1 Tax=Frigoriflavimonas asaccharolytica TaxID=2735899 RepID=A0A8J8G722_9FLAO|nr:SDR family oxidoreductase [Frigoriflavimonas asaccharolytica]NRS91880.1 NAD(P)-dependent dehydrogenase (short-subunit alcohol dehydrogenase family) [Frigoriflavimonas asaccharolytica]
MNESKKNIIVIGAGKGIGLKIVENLALQNSVYALSRTSTEEIKNLNVNFHQFDVLSDTYDQFEFPEEIHGLVYCPGSINLKPFNRLSESDFIEDFQINFLGAVKAVQHFLPALKKSRNASIVFFSTVAAKIGMPFHASIASSKGAIEGLTISLAAELSNFNIRVNAIAPSLTNTTLAEKLLSSPEKMEASANRHPLKRVGNPGEMAKIASFLLSENASWITGQVIAVDGGMGSIKN